MTLSEVLGRTWKLYTSFFARFFILAAIVFLAVNAVFAVAAALLDSSSDGQAAVIWLVGMAASVVGTFWLQGAMVFAVQDVQDGTFDTPTAEVFRRVQPHLGTLILAGLLAGLAIGVGFLLIVVPGLILLTIWSLIAPAIVVEGKSVSEAFGRSRELVRGHGWTVFGVVVVTTLLTLVAGGVLRAIFSFLPQFLEILIGSTVASAVVAPFNAIALTVMFFALRSAKGEHPAPPPA
jgi:hypothetical protein